MWKFTTSDKEELLLFSRDCLERNFGVNKPDFIVTPDFISKFSGRYGVFVSLYNKKELRACLGQMTSDLPLYKTLEQTTASAASRDYRFKPIKRKELNQIKIELSLLSPLTKIDGPDEIELGKHGIYIEKDGRSGTFLPQVSEKYDWTVEEFLGHCAESKTGIGWNGWKTANLFVYETLVFKES